VLNGTTEFSDEYEEPKFESIATLATEARTYRVYGPNSTADLLSNIEGTETDATVVVSVEDVLMKHDAFCGPAGSMTMAGVINKLSASESVSTIIFEMDCPGGSVAGTQTYAQAIMNSPKRTVAFVNEGIAASGGYWLAASCDEIYCSQSTDMVGSIGTMATLRDFSERLAKMGVKETVITSRLSSEKNKDAADALEGDTEAVKDKLDFVAGIFIAHVKEKRTINTSVADPFKGAMYFAEEAQAIGLIDGIKSWDELMKEVSAAKGSASTGVSAKNNSKNSEMKISEKLAILQDPASTEEQRTAASAAIQSAIDADEVFTQAEVDAQVAAATEGLSTQTEVDTAVATATEGLSTAAEQQSAVDAATSPLNTQIETLTSDNAELKKQVQTKTGIIEDEDDDEDQFGKKVKTVKTVIR
jgi:ClpP class serine protease